MRKVVLFADGVVGRDAVRVSLDFDPDSVAGVVCLPGRKLFDDRVTRHVEFVNADVRSTAEKIKALNGDVFILAWWPIVLAPTFLLLGQSMTLNMHPSLLPHCRGKDPNFWTLRDELPFGVTIHHVDAGIDTGDIAFQRALPYGWTDDGQTLYERACGEMVDLYRAIYPRIVGGDVPRIKQSPDLGNFHRRRDLDEASKIDLDANYTARQLLNLLRARTFPPHPACHFSDRDGKIFEVRVSITEK